MMNDEALAAVARSEAKWVCGIDEAGRGCLAGPLYAAAVILHPGQTIEDLADSKKLSPKKREFLAQVIREEAFAWGIASASAKEIDARGIEWANRIAFTRAVRDLLRRSEGRLHANDLLLCIDGNRPALRIRARQMTIPGGDRSVPQIAAASILAKTSRDRWVLEHLHARYPHFGFDAHKGYATPQHLGALRTWGATAHHRMSFTLDGVRHVKKETRATTKGAGRTQSPRED